MNEADDPNNGNLIESLNSDDSAQLESVSCPFYSVLPPQNLAIPKLLPARLVENTPPPTSLDSEVAEFQYFQDIQELNTQSNQNSSSQDWVAEPDVKQQKLVDAEFKQLLALNQELSSANNELYEQVEALKAALIKSETALQRQKNRTSVTDSMLSQQTQELKVAQEQIKSLYEQLEAAAQTAQHQELLAESYKGQLEINQQRLAQLERESALIQTNYHDQSQQLLQSENACREFRARLMRQQRQTLQFKAALEKCLESPAPNYDSLDENTQELINASASHSLSPNLQPIQPWSVAESKLLAHEPDNSWSKSSAPSPVEWDLISPQLSAWHTAKENLPTVEPEVSNHSSSENLEEQLDGLIEFFFTSQVASPSAKPPVEDVISMPKNDNHQTLDSSSILDVKSEEVGDFWLEASEIPYTPTDNSPSPIIYPQRPPKGRKSLASVELPNFGQNHQ